jgi:hypothetical protein
MRYVQCASHDEGSLVVSLPQREVVEGPVKGARAEHINMRKGLLTLNNSQPSHITIVHTTAAAAAAAAAVKHTQVNISLIIESRHAQQAVKALHKEFFEGAPNCLPKKQLVGAASNGNGNGQA